MNWLLSLIISLIFCLPQPQVALYLHVDHSDSSVLADVRINGKLASFDKENGKYIISKRQLKKNRNQLVITKPGFERMVLDADSIFTQHGHRNAVTSAVTLRHPWDGGYLVQGNKVPASISGTEMIIMNVKDSAAVFRAVRGLNLMVMRAYNYCGNFAKLGNAYEDPDTYVLMHCYGAPLQKVNSEALTALRGLLGEDNVGPAVSDNMYPKLLTSQLEIVFREGITDQEISGVLKTFGLTLYYRDKSTANLVIANAGKGMGDHVIGLANRLQSDPQVLKVTNVVNAMVCPG